MMPVLPSLPPALRAACAALALAVLVYALLARPQATPMAQVRPQAH